MTPSSSPSLFFSALNEQKWKPSELTSPASCLGHRRSLLKAEGDQLLKSLSKLGMHTTHGVFRAVNVTGNAAAVVAGGVFKLAGAAILDGVGRTGGSERDNLRCTFHL